MPRGSEQLSRGADADPAIEWVAHRVGGFEQLLVLGVATDAASRGVALLRQSAARFGIGVSLVGLGSAYPCHAFKVVALRAALEQALERYELVLFVDAYDTLFMTDLDEILAKYRALDAPFVMSAEIVRSPPEGPPEELFPPAPTPFRFPNSGGFVAPPAAVLRALERFDRPEVWRTDNDQAFWSDVYLEGGSDDAIRLDHGCSIFQCQWWSEQTLRPLRRPLARTGRMRNRVTGARPCLFHANGFCDLEAGARWILGSSYRPPPDRRIFHGLRRGRWRQRVWRRWPWRADGVAKD
ncbi:MAG: glycosyltransferase domain-containing protein [Acidobacteriota bacterium]